MFSTSLLKALASTGSVTSMTARAVPGGFVLYVRVGLEEKPVKAYRGKARTFKKLDAVANYVKELGLNRFDTVLSEWVPEFEST